MAFNRMLFYVQAANVVLEKDSVAPGEDKITSSCSASGCSVPDKTSAPAAVQPEPSQPPARTLAQPDDVLMKDPDEGIACPTDTLPTECLVRSPHFNPESPNYNKEDWPDAQPHQDELLFSPVRPDDDNKPSSTTGLGSVVVSIPDDEAHEGDSCEAQPPSPPCKQPVGKKSRKGNQGPLIAKPPVPAPHVMGAAVAHVEAHGSLDGDVEAQRALKRDLEAQAREEAEQKKLEAEQKREEANKKKREKSEQAIQKAKDKLEKLMAKSQTLETKKPKSRGVKRKLDAELAAAAQPPPSPAQMGETPVSPAPARKGKTRPASSVRLTPKAKDFALKTSPDKKACDARLAKAETSLQTLRELDLEGLKLPPDPFCKKILACS